VTPATGRESWPTDFAELTPVRSPAALTVRAAPGLTPTPEDHGMPRLLSFAAVLSSLALAATAPAQGQRPTGAKPDLNANAALKYWRGFASLPKLDKQEQERITQEAATMPLTPRVKEVVKWSEGSLHELHNGAAVPDCAWGLTFGDGISALFSECPAARLLAGLACLRARLRFADGDRGGALDDLFAALTLARHVTLGESLIHVHIGLAIENTAAEVLAADLPGLDAATLRALPARLDRLPPAGTMADALRREETEFLGWFQARVRGAADRDALVAFLDYSQGGAGRADRFAKGQALLEACGGTAAGVLARAEEVRPFYATFAAKMALPPEELARAFEAEKLRMAGNPVFQVLVPGLGNGRQAEARCDARRRMLRAAIAVQLDGRDALKAHPDPYGGGPFGYEPFDGGFVLTSKLTAQDKPWALTVGRRK
jgi:hypothetical protein